MSDPNTTHKLQEQEIAFIRRDFERLEKKVDGLGTKFDLFGEQLRLLGESFIHREEANREHTRLQEQIDKKADKEQANRLEAHQTWMNRLIIGAVITIAIAAIFTISS